MPGIMSRPKQNESGGENDGMELHEDDILEEYDIQPVPLDEQVLNDMNEMDLENFDADGDARSDDGSDGQDDADVVFSKHTGSVFCVNLDPVSANLVVSGGEDDKAYVWQASDGQVLMECTGHKDSVTAATFSHDAKYVATGDMSGVLKVWGIEARQELWGFEVSDLEWLCWHPASPVLLAGTVDGDIWMWQIPSGQCKTFQGSGRSCSVGSIMPDGTRAVAGYEDGVVKVWDLRSASALHTFSGRTGHSEALTCLVGHHDNTLLMSGSMDGTAKLLNSQTGKLLATFDCAGAEPKPAAADQENSVEAVGFCKTSSLAATGTLVGALSIWDIPTQKQRQQCMHEAGIVRLAWADSSPLLYTCTLDGTCHLWDARSGRREGQWRGHTEEILDLAVAKDSSIMATACGDKTARIFNLNSPDR